GRYNQLRSFASRYVDSDASFVAALGMDGGINSGVERMNSICENILLVSARDDPYTQLSFTEYKQILQNSYRLLADISMSHKNIFVQIPLDSENYVLQ